MGSMVSFRAVVTSLIVLGACSVGEVPGAGPDGGTGGGSGSGMGGGQSFNAIVKPIVSRCAVPGCHSGTQAPNLSDFSQLTAPYKTKPGSNNILVIKGTLTQNSHSGMPWLTSEEQTKIANWIDSLP
jgi:hypothetical protein